MLNILKERLLTGMEIEKVKEKYNKYEITFLIDGNKIYSELPKTCAPGYHNRIVDCTIFNAMAYAAINRGDVKEAKMWMDKIIHPDEV